MNNTTRMFAATAILSLVASSQAATINFSSLETVLAAPTDMNSKMSALWTGWATQVYEYTMPFIEIANETNAPFSISTFRMTIGDTAYHFSNEFSHKKDTNSYPYPADGTFAITGFSTPNASITSSVEDGGNTLVVNFGDGGIAPGEVVRFQVNLARDNPTGMMFPNYLDVFTDPTAGNDTTGNSTVTFAYNGTTKTASGTLPNFPVSSSVLNYMHTPRPYSIMQPIDVYPGTPFGFEEIPEPTAGLLAMLAVAGLAGRRNA